MDNLKNFIIYLAKQAHPNRVYPFPDAFRESLPSPPLAINQKSNNDGDASLGTSFAKYTQQEYAQYNQVLNSIDDKALANPTDRQKQVLDYLFGMLINISYHGKSINPYITEYEFKYSGVEERIRDYKYKERWYLYHGSNIGNWHSIIRNGIKNMSRTSLMSTGAVLGPGVYLTSDLSTAISYGMSGTMSCVSVVEIMEDPTPYKKNSTVYVIPNDKILLPRYLYQIKNMRVAGADDDELLKYYQKSKNAQLKPFRKNMKARIERDLENIKPLNTYVLEMVNDETYIIMIDDIMVSLLLDNYPFSAPIFKLIYEINTQHEHNELPKEFMNNGVYTPPLINWAPQNNLAEIVKQIKTLLTGYIMTETEFPEL